MFTFFLLLDERIWLWFSVAVLSFKRFSEEFKMSHVPPNDRDTVWEICSEKDHLSSRAHHRACLHKADGLARYTSARHRQISGPSPETALCGSWLLENESCCKRKERLHKLSGSLLQLYVVFLFSLFFILAS